MPSMSLSKKTALFFTSLFFCFFATKAEALAGASFSLSPSSGVCAPGGTFDVDIMLESDELTSGTTAILNYDPSILEALALSNGDIFPEVLLNDIDADLGVIRFDAYIEFSNPEDFSGSGVFATVTFTVLDVGDTTLSFDFAGEGETTDSNVAHADTYQDILTSVSDGSYSFQEGYSGESICGSENGSGGADDGFEDDFEDDSEDDFGGGSVPTPTPTVPAYSGEEAGGDYTPDLGDEAPGGGVLGPTIFVSLLSLVMIGTGLILR